MLSWETNTMCTSSVSVYSGTSQVNESQRASRSGSKLRKLAPSPLRSARWTQSPPLARVAPAQVPSPPGHARPSASSGRPAPRPSASTKRPPSCSTPPRLVLDPLPLVARYLSPFVPCNLPASCPDASPLPAGCQATLKSHFRSSHLF